MRGARQFVILFWGMVVLLVGAAAIVAQKKTVSKNSSTTSATLNKTENIDYSIAAAFAPIFNQSLGDQPRSDYITKFDFDGDWQGDNNWANAADRRFPLLASIYYSVAETQTHYFITYAVFHPRDYKGGEKRGTLLSEVIQLGAEALGKNDPTGGLAEEATLAHENDMEGVLVVVEKAGNNLANAKVRYVETLAHNRFLKYTPESEAGRGDGFVRLIDGRPELYIEPKGHGILSNTADKKQGERKLIYTFTGKAEDPDRDANGNKVSYDLIPIYSTLWSKALTGESQTYARINDYTSLFTLFKKNQLTADSKPNPTIKIRGNLGSAFRGNTGGKNMARPPWGWFDSSERARPLGEWFFDPAATIKRHFNLAETFSTSYIHSPIIGIMRKG